MSKKKKNNKRENVQTNSLNLFLPEHIDKNELQNIIANALIESEEIKKQREEKQHEEELKNWQKTIGYKDYSNSTSKFKFFLQFWNDISILLKVCFISESKITGGDRVISNLLKIIPSLFFIIVKWLLTILALFIFLLIPFQVVNADIQVPLYINMLFIILSIVVFMFSRIFKIASIEVDKMEDRGYLVGIFASITSTLSIIIAIIAVVRGG